MKSIGGEAKKEVGTLDNMEDGMKEQGVDRSRLEAKSVHINE